MSIPVKLRGQTLGVLNIKAPKTDDESRQLLALMNMPFRK
jgi:hypothetical protein